MDLTGKRVGRLVVVEKSHSDNGVFWKCQCDCGTEKAINTSTLNGGNVKSCGCLYKETRHRGLGEDSPSWKGGEYINYSGYVMKSIPEDHPRKQYNGYIREHILIAERAIGKELPEGVQVHHYGATGDNSKIVICENQEYHFLLHIRAKALKECGHAGWRKCKFCQQYDSLDNIYCVKINGKKGGWNTYHMECARAYDRKMYRRKHGKVKTISN